MTRLAPMTSRTIAAALIADPKERDTAIRGELAALCRGVAALSMHYRTGGPLTAVDARAVLEHAHVLFGLALSAEAASAP